MNTSEQTASTKPREPVKTPCLSTLQLSEAQPEVAVETCQELDRALHRAELQCPAQHPMVVSLYVRGHRLEIGLGLPQSFVSIQRREPTPGPRYLSLGAGQAGWGVVSFFDGWRRLDVPERSLVPASQARQILRDFFETGTRSTVIEWETL